MPKRFRLAALVAAASMLVGPAVATGAEQELGPEARQQIARARAATARYHDLQRAIADGYVDIDVYVPGMGFHYLRPDLLDDRFDPEQPELLVYAPDDKGQLRLVAAEYAVPLSLAPAPPDGFDGEADVWDANQDFGIWTLHAWIWRSNPNGMFAELNPRVR